MEIRVGEFTDAFVLILIYYTKGRRHNAPPLDQSSPEKSGMAMGNIDGPGQALMIPALISRPPCSPFWITLLSSRTNLLISQRINQDAHKFQTTESGLYRYRRRGQVYTILLHSQRREPVTTNQS